MDAQLTGGTADAQHAAPAQAHKQGRLKDVAFNSSTCVWTWTPSATRLVCHTWLQAQIRDGPSDVRLPYRSVGGHLPLDKVKALAGQNVSVRGSDDRENGPESVRLPFWDLGLQQLVDRLREEDVEMRLSVFGGVGEADIGYSVWIRVRELLAIAKGAQPATWEEDLADAEKRRQEKKAEMQENAEKRRQEKKAEMEEDARKEPDRKRKREKRQAREAAAAAERQVAAAAAPAGTSWRSYDGSSLGGLSTFAEGWETREVSTQEKVDHHGATMVFRSGVKQQEFIVANEAEMLHLILQFCAKLPKHAVVDVNRNNLDGFEGGSCYIVDQRDSKVKVKSVVGGGTKAINKKDIHHSNEKDFNWGVTSLKKHFKTTKPVPFEEWLAQLSDKRAAPRGAAAAAAPEPAGFRSAAEPAEPAEPAAAPAAAAGALDQPPTPAWTAEHSSAVTAADSKEEDEESASRRQSETFKAPSEPAIKVKPENGSAPIELMAGKPLEEAEANKGTLQNKKVFVGDSTVGPQAGKGLFVAQAIGKNEVISKFQGDVVEPDADLEFKSHVITLEQANGGRQLDCYSICKHFTASSKLTTPVGCYPARGNSYFPVTDRSQDGKSLYEVGLAAFANSSSETDFKPNCRVERTKYRGGEATGYLPQAFLIATRALRPGEEVLFEYPVVIEAARDGAAGEDDAPEDDSDAAAAEATHKRGRDEAHGGAAKVPKLAAAAAAPAAPAAHGATAAPVAACAAAAQHAAAEQQPGAAAGAGADGASDEVAALLTNLQLVKWGPALLKLGADEMLHLKQLEDDDLAEIGMPKLHRRTLLRALGTQPAAAGGGGAAARH